MKTKSIITALVAFVAIMSLSATVMGRTRTKASKAAPVAAAAAADPVAAVDSTTLCAATIYGHMVRQQLDQFAMRGIVVDPATFCSVFTTAFLGDSTGVSEDAADAYMVAQFNKANEAELASLREAERSFMAAASAMDSTLTTPSGLVIRVVQPGGGANPSIDSVVKLKYSGYLADGTMFDSSDGQDVEMNVGSLIPGFTEGLLMMKTGGTYELFIPSDLAYGQHGAGGVIPPCAPLRFVVTLDEVMAPTPTPAP